METPLFPLRIAAVVVDLDGTLLDTAADLAGAAARMAADLDLPPVAIDTLKTYIGNGIPRLVKRVLTGSMDGEPDAALFVQALERYQDRYAEGVSRHSRPFPGVVEGLDAMKAAGFRLACITNKAQRFTLPLLQDTALAAYFELVLSGDSLPKQKPDPLPLQHACRYFGIAPAQLLLIGDSQNDVEAARAAGSHVFCVPYGYNHGRGVDELSPDAIVPTLLDASKLIRIIPT